MIKKMNFIFCAFTLRKLPNFYTSIINDLNNELILLNEDGDPLNITNKVLVIEDVPRYFKVAQSLLPREVGMKTLKQYPGFLINFDGINDLDQYLSSQFGRSSRYKLRRSIKKLESCFDIRYKMFHGQMSKEEYDFIFEEFYRLLAIRSAEKGIKNNRNLKTKAVYYELVYPMILDKKASFYVIYDRNIPIDICLNFHLDNVIFQFIRTYDIDYSKFNTGYIDLMKQIEWCIAKNIKFISFSKGDFYWKRRWCNTVYDYDYHVLYDKRSLKTVIKANLFCYKMRLWQILREKNIIKWYHNNIRDKRLKILASLHKNPEFKIFDFDKKINPNEIERVEYGDQDYISLKRVINEFLFEYNENEKNVRLYKLIEIPSSYLLCGKKEQKSIHLV